MSQSQCRFRFFQSRDYASLDTVHGKKSTDHCLDQSMFCTWYSTAIYCVPLKCTKNKARLMFAHKLTNLFLFLFII